MRVSRLVGALAGLALVACDQSHPVAPLSSTDPRVQRSIVTEHGQPWPPEKARTWPVVAGVITVQP